MELKTSEIPAVRALRALGDQSRVRAVAALSHAELCVCQIVELLGLAPSTVSKHMAVLKEAGLVSSRKDGRWVTYRLATGAQSDFHGTVVARLLDEVAPESLIRSDHERLLCILRVDREELCRRQKLCA